MGTNKNPIARYLALNKCFRNPGKRYFMEDLIEECNRVLRELNPDTSGIKRRQVFEDINFMESAAGYDAEILKEKEGRKVYYRYADMSFSIRNATINETEAAQLKEALLTLSRFKGMPQFEWLEELKTRLEDSFGFLKQEHKIIEFDQNPYLKGIEILGDLYTAIAYKKTLRIEYKSFKKEEVIVNEISPYYLKQYNNRWFLFGQTHGTNEELPYIESKPLHGSQKIVERGADFTTLSIEVKINYELQSLLLSHRLEVVTPIKLRGMIQQQAEAILKGNC